MTRIMYQFIIYVFFAYVGTWCMVSKCSSSNTTWWL